MRSDRGSVVRQDRSFDKGGDTPIHTEEVAVKSANYKWQIEIPASFVWGIFSNFFTGDQNQNK